MISTPERDERRSYEEALSLARARLANNASDLDAAPVYLSRARGGPWRQLDPRLQIEIDRLRAIEREALDHRQAISALEAELDEFDSFFRNPSERARISLAFRTWINNLRDPSQLLDELIPDPRRRYLGKSAALRLRTAEEILDERAARGGDIGPLASLPFLDVDDVRDLEYTARRRMDPVSPAQSVAVLLPLRIETRFDRPDAVNPRWRLRLRLFPETASILRDDGPSTESERAHTELMWHKANGDLRSPEGKLAFQRLAEQCGGERACWLARTLPVVRETPDGPLIVEPVVAREAQSRHFHRPIGLPRQIEIWLARGGNPPAQAAVLDVDPATIARHSDVREQFGEGSGFTGTLPLTWWLSFEAAKKVGLAAEIPLETIPPVDIDALYVVGVDDGSARALFESHATAGSLAVLGPGTPTNTVAGEPAAAIGRNIDEWYALATTSGLAEPGSRPPGARTFGRKRAAGPACGRRARNPCAG